MKKLSEERCPVCNESMSDHHIEVIELASVGTDTLTLETHRIPAIGYAIACAKTKPRLKQGMCFSAIPDSMVFPVDQSFENESENGVYGIN